MFSFSTCDRVNGGKTTTTVGPSSKSKSTEIGSVTPVSKITGKHTDYNGQNPTSKANKLLGLKNEAFDPGVLELDCGS